LGGDPVGASAERYLETVYILERTGNAIAARVAEQLGVRAPSVTQALRRLEAAGWLRVAPDHSVHLWPADPRRSGPAHLRRGAVPKPGPGPPGASGRKQARLRRPEGPSDRYRTTTLLDSVTRGGLVGPTRGCPF